MPILRHVYENIPGLNQINLMKSQIQPIHLRKLDCRIWQNAAPLAVQPLLNDNLHYVK